MVENFYKKLNLNASIHALPRNLQTLLETVHHLNENALVEENLLSSTFFPSLAGLPSVALLAADQKRCDTWGKTHVITKDNSSVKPGAPPDIGRVSWAAWRLQEHTGSGVGRGSLLRSSSSAGKSRWSGWLLQVALDCPRSRPRIRRRPATLWLHGVWHCYWKNALNDLRHVLIGNGFVVGKRYSVTGEGTLKD